MINKILSFIDEDDYQQIFKALTYSIYKGKALSLDEINFLNNLIYHFTHDEDILSTIYTFDSRIEFDFKNLAENTNLSSSKILLFLLSITASLFENSDLEKFIKDIAIKDLQFDSKIKNDIPDITKKYTDSSIELFDYIYQIGKVSLLSKKSKNTFMPYQKVSLIDEDKILELQDIEKNAFLQVLAYLMLEDKKISDLEKDILLMYATYFGINEKNFDINMYNTITLDTIKEIQTEWFKNLLICLYILSQDTNEKKSDFCRLYEVAKMLELSKKDVETAIKLTNNYKNHFEMLINILCSDKRYILKNETAYEKAAIAIDGVSTIISLIPQLKTVTTLAKFGHTALSYRKNTTGIDYGLCEIKKNNSSDEMIICIDGFLSESNNKQFDDWSKTFENLKINSRIKGFKWPSCNWKLNNPLALWPNAVANTDKAASRLINDISLLIDMKPDLKITLAGHSLGSRIIYTTLINLKELNFKIENVYLLGGAVSRTEKAGWTEALSSVNKKLYNFYSNNDDILRRLYLGDKPIGLGEIEYYKNKDLIVGELVNIDVSHLINGHTEYKDKLQLILTENNIYEYSLLGAKRNE